MHKVILSAMTLLVFGAVSAGDLSGQLMNRQAHPGSDVMSINVYGGGFFSANTLEVGTEFDDTGTAGGAATFWLHRNMGVRGNVLWASPSVIADPANELFAEDPDVWHYSGDLVLRMPLPATEQVSWFPYLVGGLGGKTYNFETLESATDVAGNIGAGVELRFGQNGRLGVNTEVRDFISNFERIGFDQTLNDVIWTGGVTVSF